jgi:CO/xanthine dehydrogenase FAD-binding subunit
MFDFDVLIPQTTQELLGMLSDPSTRLLAGGTDLIPRMRRNPPDSTIVLIDMSRLHELSFIRERESQIEIGALTTHTNLLSSPLLRQSTPALLQACSSIGAQQTRARGTLGGNLANASPAADTAAPLLALNAQVVLRSIKGERSLPLNGFFIAPGKTQLQPGEFIHSVRIPLPRGRWGSDFLKLGRRKGMAIAVASAAVYLELDEEGLIQCIRVSMGSVAPTPVRAPHAEAVLLGNRPAPALFEKASFACQADIAPIDDIRASAAYRLHSAQILLQRVLQTACMQASEKTE